MVYCIHVHIWMFSQPKLAGICIMKMTKTTGRGLFVSMCNYFLAILPSFGQFVHQWTCLCHENHATTVLLRTFLKFVHAWQLFWNLESARHKVFTYTGLHKYRNTVNNVFTPRMSFEFTLQTLKGRKTAGASESAGAVVATIENKFNVRFTE